MRRQKTDPPPPTEPPDPRAIALRLLARREHSRAELIVKLQRRGVPGAQAEATAQHLENEGLLSEQRFIEQMVRIRLRQGYGPFRIRADLRTRGIDSGIIEPLDSIGEEEWTTRADAARQRHFGAAPPNSPQARVRLARFLERRGYSAAQIARVLSEQMES